MFFGKRLDRMLRPVSGVRRGMVASLVCLGGILGCLPWSLAQQPPTGPPVHVPSQETFSKQELEAFAEAHVALKDLQGDREGSSNPGHVPGFSARIKKEIEAHGLTLERYKRISTAMNRDMALRMKVKRLINDLENSR